MNIQKNQIMKTGFLLIYGNAISNIVLDKIEKMALFFLSRKLKTILKENPQQNPEELFVIIPYEFYDDYSYATEHLSHDTLIYTLSKTIQVLKIH